MKGFLTDQLLLMEIEEYCWRLSFHLAFHEYDERIKARAHTLLDTLLRRR
jgi:hypothetical protein